MLSIIIVNYKTPHLVLDCLRTISDETKNIAFEVIIVDNASNDESRSLIFEKMPWVKWIQMNYNAGFARANNEGIRQATGDSFLLLNSDTLIQDKAIEKCYLRLSGANYAASGVQLFNVDGSPQISGNYVIKGGLNYLLPLPFLGNFFKRIAYLLNVKKTNIPYVKKIAEVDWINGAFLMVKRSAIEKAGLLDEDFFLYAEEAEWCGRIKNAGPLCIFGDLRVIHLEGSSANQTFGSKGKGYYNMYDKKGLQIVLSNLVRIRKQFGIFWYLFILTIYSIDIPVFFIGLLFQTFRNNKIYTWKEFTGFTKNILGIWKLTPIVISGRPYFYKVL